MITAIFRYADRTPLGFILSGHAGAGVAGEDIVCAAVSSAAYMTANTLTEVCKAAADITVADGEMSLTLQTPTKDTTTILQGFILHLTALAQQYPQRISLQNMEV